jgi:hypothetical protein
MRASPSQTTTSGGLTKDPNKEKENNDNDGSCGGQPQSAPPLPPVSTPGRDAATLVAKRLQHVHLDLDNIDAQSPMRTFSPLPTGRSGPGRSLNASAVAPARHNYDLTPVMRNTSARKDSAGVIISPDDDLEEGGEGCLLSHRDHLAMPADFCKSNNAFSARLVHPDQLPCSGPMLPPLPSHHVLFPASTCDRKHLEAPVQFPPPSKGGYSFTSRKQYEKRHKQELGVPGAQLPPFLGGVHANAGSAIDGLTPYQPSRQDLDFQEVGEIPSKELDRIFISKRSRAVSDKQDGGAGTLADRQEGTFEVSPVGTTMATSTDTPTTDSDDQLDPAQEELVQFPPIPLEDRKWSIPTIRLANHLDGSVTSNTTNADQDDESQILYRESGQYDDDASLSSLGSLSILSASREDHEHPSIVIALPTDQHRQSQLSCQDQGQTGGEQKGSFLLEEDDPDQSIAHCHRLQRRQRQKERRERRAYEWLRTVKAGNDQFAEAASSKFLTGRNNFANTLSSDNYTNGHHRPQKRPSAAMVETRTLAFVHSSFPREDKGDQIKMF